VSDTDPDTATAWFATALHLIPRHLRFQEQRAGLLVRLAKARGACGHLRECRDTIHEALRILPGQGLAEHARAVAFAAKVQRLLGAYAETSAMLRAEIETLSDCRSAAAAELKFELAAERLQNGDLSASLEWARQAMELTQVSSDPGFQAGCLGVMTKACIIAGDLAAAEEYLARATIILDGMLDGEFTGGLDALEWIGWSEVLLGRWDDALRHFSKGVTFAAAAGLRLILPHLLVGQVYVLRSRGRLVEAQAAAEHAVHLAEQSGSPEQLVSAHAMRSWTESILGWSDQALRNATIATSQPDDAASGWGGTLALRVLAEARLMAGDPEGCLGLVSKAGGPGLPRANPYSRIAWYELLTRAELAEGRPYAAAKWADLAVQQAIALDQPGRMAVALLARTQVMLAQDPVSALPTAKQAVDALTRGGMTIDALRARIMLGTALWHRQQHDDALSELKDAEEALNGIGAAGLARIARTERNRLAGRMSRTKGSSGGSEVAAALTGREWQVAKVVEEGLTNRMIAKQLNITEKTVEMHLSNVFSKLGVSNRAALAGRMARDRPAEPEQA
jgi:DNA-binding NarL/FixJ family response regulator